MGESAVKVMRSVIAGVCGLGAAACEVSTAARGVTPFGVDVPPSITATSSVSGSAGNETIHVAVTLTNTDASPHTFTVRMPCPLLVHLYTSPARAGPPAYADEFAPGGCKSYFVTDTLAPHATVTYRSNVPPWCAR